MLFDRTCRRIGIVNKSDIRTYFTSFTYFKCVSSVLSDFCFNYELHILVSHVLSMEAVLTYAKVVFLFLYNICYDEVWNYRGYRKEFKCPMLSL